MALQLSIRSRVYGGCGVLVMFSVVIAGFAIWQLMSISKMTGVTEHYSAQAERIETINRAIETMRRMASVYKYDADLERVDGFKFANKKATAALAEAIDQSLSIDRKKAYADIQTRVAALGQKFDDFVTVNMQVDAEKDNLFKGGDELTATTGKLVIAAREAGLETLAARTESSILLVRVTNWRFLATRDPKGPATFKTNLDRAKAALADLDKENKDGVARLINPVRSALSAYANAFQGASDGTMKMDIAFNDELQPLMDDINKVMAIAKDSFARDFTANQQMTHASSDRTVLISEIVAVLAPLVGGLIAFFVGRGLIKPIAGMTDAMTVLAGGNTAVVVPSLDAKDEMGSMARAVEVFKINALDVARMRREQEATEAERIAQRKADMLKLTGDFESAVGEIIQTVSSAATELEGSANTLSSTASRTEELSALVAAAAEEASANVQSVASASEEMSSSVSEISRQMQESARIAGDAVAQAETTNARVHELSESAKKIGDVVKLISTIAGQTNLLALNATIEAARAGDAGRGFAVVASEVKALAEQTSKATGEIGQQIAAIQTATESSVFAISEIGQTIGRISEISSAIAAAVEEQGAATQEISRNVQQAAQGTAEVAANISDVQRGSSETGSASSQVLSSARSLSTESNRLKSEVQEFLATVRAA